MDEGLVRGLGICNANLSQVEALLAEAKHKPLALQVCGCHQHVTPMHHTFADALLRTG